jgi:hypothetical protein
MLPSGCLPLWGREGVTLIFFKLLTKNWIFSGFLQSRNYCFLQPAIRALAAARAAMASTGKNGDLVGAGEAAGD